MTNDIEFEDDEIITHVVYDEYNYDEKPMIRLLTIEITINMEF